MKEREKLVENSWLNKRRDMATEESEPTQPQKVSRSLVRKDRKQALTRFSHKPTQERWNERRVRAQGLVTSQRDPAKRELNLGLRNLWISPLVTEIVCYSFPRYGEFCGLSASFPCALRLNFTFYILLLAS
jgi:hypothetical protein